MKESHLIVVFSLDGQRYGLPLVLVERIIGAAEITPLPKAPEIVLGIINLQGKVIPVMNIRKRFGLPDRELSPDHQFIIAKMSERTVALLVENVIGVMKLSENSMVLSDTITPGMEYVRGVLTCADGLILICDLDAFLSLEEAKVLSSALNRKKRRNKDGGNGIRRSPVQVQRVH